MSTETVESTSKKRAEPVRTPVTLEDGRTVDFVGTRKMQKEATVSDEGVVHVRFDFANGATRSVTFLPGTPIYHRLAAHGALQKIGDTASGEKDIDDAVVCIEDSIYRLEKGEWGVERAAGDGFSGASVVIRAIAEVRGITPAEVKTRLEAIMAEKGCTRQQLYAAFRAPGTKTAEVIARIEAEKAAKKLGVDGNDLLEEV